MPTPSRATAALVLSAGLALLGGCAGGAASGTTALASAPDASSSTSSAPSTTPAAGADGSPCQLGLLRASVTPPAAAQYPSQRTVRVVWTNTGSQTCTLSGFGHVILQSAAGQDWTVGTQYALREQEVAPPSTRLAPNGQAHTVVTYAPEDGATMSGTYTPATMIVTPPGSDSVGAAVLAWPGGPVSYQAGATRPGSFFGPVEPGA